MVKENNFKNHIVILQNKLFVQNVYDLFLTILDFKDNLEKNYCNENNKLIFPMKNGFILLFDTQLLAYIIKHLQKSRHMI